MKVYKFRALSNFDRIADILINKRFHASKWLDLNDPMEGVFDHEADIDPTFVEKVKKEMDNTRICCFSKSFGSPLLWAYYADGFKGICLEIELDESICSSILKVTYDNRLLTLFEGLESFEGIFPSVALSKKYEAWAPEDEIRVLTEDQFVTSPCAEITSIWFGLRTPVPVKQLIVRSSGDSLRNSRDEMLRIAWIR